MILKFINQHGHIKLVEVPEDTMCIKIEINDSITNSIVINDEGRVPGSVSTEVIVDGATYNFDTPETALSIGKMDEEGYLWRTEAVLYATDNGRLLAQNQTQGYSSTPKPVATKPWTRRDISYRYIKKSEKGGTL